MDFFDAIERPGEQHPIGEREGSEPAVPPWVMAPWVMAPRDWLGCAAGAPVIVARSASTVVGLQAVTAYPEGCELQLRAIVRRATDQDEDRWWIMQHTMFGPPTRRGARPDTMLRIGVQFADGRKATNTFRPYLPDASHTPPTEPVLMDGQGGASGGGDSEFTWDRTMWLWPLPPPEPFDLIVQWPALDIPLSRVQLDGAAIAAAAERAVPLWE